MRQPYSALLSLYPAEYRAVFAAEMLETFEQAAADRRRQGLSEFLYFAGSELAGLVVGFPREWIAKWTNGQKYTRSCLWSKERSNLPWEVVETQARRQKALSSMVFAIAHHDFRGARLHSEEERIACEQLVRHFNLNDSHLSAGEG